MYKGESRKSLQFTGNSPLSVARHQKEVLRCNACGYEAMSNKKIVKWENSARSALALYKTMGMPWYRLANLQELYATPVSTSTMWMQVAALWTEAASFIFEQLKDEVARSNHLYCDDTGATILEVIQDNKELPEDERRASHTTTVCATRICPETKAQSKIAIYITDNKYCGENIAPILDKRYLENPEHYISITADGSSQNIPHIGDDLLKKVIIAGCLFHARSKYYDLLPFWPEECQYFLDEIASIYKIEGECENMSDKQRLKHHKKYSRIHITNIYTKIRYLFDKKLVEPNSSLGKAMNYWLKHKRALTTFLRVKGVALDNNEAERALKTIILQRKNSLFFYSKKSAMILSGFSSIAATCRLNNINSFGYLNWIQENWLSVQKDPSKYMPWDWEAMKSSATRPDLVAA